MTSAASWKGETHLPVAGSLTQMVIFPAACVAVGAGVEVQILCCPGEVPVKESVPKEKDQLGR